MAKTHALEMRGVFDLDRERQHRGPILVALAAPHGDLVATEIDVLDAQAAALEQT